MKAINWLTLLMLGITCFLWWVIMLIVQSCIYRVFVNKGYFIPIVTDLVVSHPFWILLFPLPWLGYLLIFPKTNDNVKNSLVYLISVLGGLLILASILILGTILPWMMPLF